MWRQGIAEVTPGRNVEAGNSWGYPWQECGGRELLRLPLPWQECEVRELLRLPQAGMWREGIAEVTPGRNVKWGSCWGYPRQECDGRELLRLPLAGMWREGIAEVAPGKNVKGGSCWGYPWQECRGNWARTNPLQTLIFPPRQASRHLCVAVGNGQRCLTVPCFVGRKTYSESNGSKYV